jgi:hypothetical protein
MNNVGSLSEMVNSSINVLTRPSVRTFEAYERRGNLQSALIYVGVAALVAGVFGLLGGISGFIGSFLGVIVNFLLFAGSVYYIGRSQGGTGTFDEVAYTFALFMAPLSLLGRILTLVFFITIIGIFFLPLLALAFVAAYVYFGYLAVQSSMNLTDRGKIWITLGGAAIITWIGNILINNIFT